MRVGAGGGVHALRPIRMMRRVREGFERPAAHLDVGAELDAADDAARGGRGDDRLGAGRQNSLRQENGDQDAVARGGQFWRRELHLDPDIVDGEIARAASALRIEPVAQDAIASSSNSPDVQPASVPPSADLSIRHHGVTAGRAQKFLSRDRPYEDHCGRRSWSGCSPHV